MTALVKKVCGARHGRPRVVAAVLILAATVAGVQASTPRFWQVSTQTDLQRGEVDRLSIDQQGRLVLGPDLTVIHEATDPFIWCLVAGAEGSLFAGTGNDGRVLHIDRQGKTRVYFDAAELEVHAMALAPDGGLYVGTSPDGKVYRVESTGQSSVVFDPEDKYIWALALDTQGRLYVGTGDKGVLYRVGPDGKGDVFYRTHTNNVTSLAFDRQGQLLASTESPGRVLRIDGSGKAFVVLESAYRELRALRVDDTGAVYVAAVNGKASGGDAASTTTQIDAPRSSPVPSVSTEIVSMTVLDTPATAGGGAPRPPQPQPTPGSKGAVFRIASDGGYESLWEFKDDLPFDLHLEANGSLLVSTGNAGKIYRLAGDPTRALLLTRLGGQQVTAMLMSAAGRYVATSNPSKIYIQTGDRAAEGTYVSEVKDAGNVAAWGTLSWRAIEDGTSRVEVSTRSGNTSTPDDTWSPWTGPYQQADGDAVRSPAARYFQWKVRLAAGSPPSNPALVSVRIAYLQRNVRPRVTSITVQPPGLVFQKPFSTGEPDIAGMSDAAPESRVPVFSTPLGTVPASPSAGPTLGRRLYQKGLQAFVWKADDDNDDKLQYDVFYRTEDDTTWNVLRRATTDQILVWDTTSVPDGTYLIKVVASDAPTNPAGIARSGDLESSAFEIDNTPPVITVAQVAVEAGRTRVTLVVRDPHSGIDRVEYAVDAGRWQPVYPVDGAADSRSERYELSLEGEIAGHVVVRAVDTMGNIATARADTLRQKTR